MPGRGDAQDDATRHAGLVGALLASLDSDQRDQAARPFTGTDDVERRSWSYLPGERQGLALHALDRDQQQHALRVLAAALRAHAFAQVAAVLALEDVLDLQEGGGGRPHRGDYWVTVFGTPGADRWGWRFEGHHVSVNVCVADGSLRAVPLFLGANPAAVRHAGIDVLRPLAPEEDVARALLAALGPADRRRAVRSGEAPPDIRTARRPQVDELTAEGVAAGELDDTARELLQRLVRVYLDRLPERLAAPQLRALDEGGWASVHFQWRGSTDRGRPHYYAVTGPRLLIEYDNTQNGANHIHSVLRDPRGDFGADLLAEHYARHHPRGQEPGLGG